MRTVLPLVYRHVRWREFLPAVAVIAMIILGLLAFAGTWSGGTALPRLDGPDLAPFRWIPLGNTLV
jgi:sulfite exporter TauE/SafE